MGPTLGDVLVRVAVDMAQLQAGLSAAEARLRAFAGTAGAAATTTTARWTTALNTLGTKMTSLGTKMQAVGRSMTRYLSLPLIGVGVVAGKFAADFETAMAKVKALSGGAGMSLREMEAAMEGISKQTGVGMRDLADALYFIASAGLKASDVMPVLEQTARGVAVEMGDAATIGQVLTSILYDYADSGMTAARAMDVLTSAIKEGKAEPSDLAASLGEVLPVASQMGIALEDVVAVIAAMTNAGTSTSRAVTSLRYAIANLQGPSLEAKNVLHDYNIGLGELQRLLGQPMGILEVFTMLAEKFDLTTVKGREAFQTVVGGARGMRAAAVLVGESSEKVRESMERIYDSAGLFDKAVGKMEETTRHKFRVAMAELEEALIDLGNIILPVIVNDVLPALQGMVKWFDDLSPATKEWAVKLGVLAIALGPVVRLVGTLVKLGGSALKVIAGLGAASAAAGAMGGGAAAGAGAGLFSSITALVKSHPLGTLAAIAVAIGGIGLAMDKADRETREYNETLAQAKLVITGVNQAMLVLADGTVIATGNVKEMQDALAEMAHKAEIAQRFGENLSQAWLTFFENLSGVSRENKQVMSALVERIIELQGSFKGLTATQVQNLLKVGDLDSAYKLLREKLNKLAGPIADVVSQFSRAAMVEEEVTEKSARTALGLRQVGQDAQTSQEKVRGYHGQLNKLPDRKRTIINAIVQQALSDIARLKAAIQGIPKDVPIYFRIVTYGKMPAKGGGKHHGGAIMHAGGLADDEVPAILQRGEYVINRRSAARLGRGLLDQLNKYHTGAPVGGPITPGGTPYVAIAGVPEVTISGIVKVELTETNIHALASALAGVVGSVGSGLGSTLAEDLIGGGGGGGGGDGGGLEPVGWDHKKELKGLIGIGTDLASSGSWFGYGNLKKALKMQVPGTDIWKLLAQTKEGKKLLKGGITQKEVDDAIALLIEMGALGAYQGGELKPFKSVGAFEKWLERQEEKKDKTPRVDEDEEDKKKKKKKKDKDKGGKKKDIATTPPTLIHPIVEQPTTSNPAFVGPKPEEFPIVGIPPSPTAAQELGSAVARGLVREAKQERDRNRMSLAGALGPSGIPGLGEVFGVSGATIIINHYGDNYGIEDFSQMVGAALGAISRRRGGL